MARTSSGAVVAVQGASSDPVAHRQEIGRILRRERRTDLREGFDEVVSLAAGTRLRRAS